ncbi:hypothetical protein ACVDG5_026820 [Mesorhizobium sp. ORM6]
MAMNAVARETVFALRRQIAKIEGTLPERLQAPAAAPLVPTSAPMSRPISRSSGAALPRLCRMPSCPSASSASMPP